MNQASKYMNLLDERPGLTGAVCLLILLVILVAGLWPFNFFPKNKVIWLPDRDGVFLFGQQSMIISADNTQKGQPPPFPTRSMTLELWLRPAMETGNAPSILTLYDGKTPELLAIKQWRSHLAIWSRADDPIARKRGKPYQEMGFRNALLKGRDAFITIASSAEGTILYLNGEQAQTYPRRRLLAGTPQGNIRLILGNSPTGDSDWAGSIMGLALYNRTLTPDQVARDYQSWLQNDSFSIKQETGLVGLYPFYERRGDIVHNAANADELLMIPEAFKPPQRKGLSSPWRDFQWSLSYFQDVAINLLGFIPLGFFFSAFLLKATGRKKSTVYVVTAVLGITISFSIELLQVHLPTRSPQMTDVLMNSAGTILGIVVFQIVHKNR